MNTSIDIEPVEYIYRERGIEPAFIEKDWYAVKVLKAISEFSHEGITPIFTGGISLPKGHGLLQRFSEDLDFRAWFETSTLPNRTEKRVFRTGNIIFVMVLFLEERSTEVLRIWKK